MKVIKFEEHGYCSNTYAVTENGTDAVVVDPSSEDVVSKLKNLGLKCRYVLLTHGHFDHVGGCRSLCENGAEILCGKDEEDFIFSKANLSIFGGVEIPPFKVSKTLADGQKFCLCGINFTALSAPGHTAGGMCYIAGNCLFSGDSLFKSSVGRTDLPGGDPAAYSKTLSKLKNLAGDYTVYPGHGETTTLASERENNPFLKYIC